jgi:hypothetical protein
MPDYFKSPKQKLARANKHIEDLERELDTFFGANPWTHAVEIDANGIFMEHKIKLTREFPDVITDTLFDAVVNLRTALDQVGHSCAWAAGNAVNSGTYFPFGATEADMENTIMRGNCKNIPPDIVTLMRTFKPYRTTDRLPLLWAINKAASVDKHALLKPVGACLLGAHISGSLQPIPLPNGPRWIAEKNEIIFARSRVDGPSMNYQFDLSPDVAFGEVDVVAGLPVLGFIHEMAHIVESILVAIEREMRRLFPNAFV